MSHSQNNKVDLRLYSPLPHLKEQTKWRKCSHKSEGGWEKVKNRTHKFKNRTFIIKNKHGERCYYNLRTSTAI